jgi:protein involved in polysaccharide export with SLBB domain
MRASHLGSLTVVALAVVASASASAPGARRQPPAAAQYRVLVTGAVRYPGRATLSEDTMSVADALAAVGSPTTEAGDEVVVIRPMRPGGLPERVVIALKDVELATPGVDVSLRDGDIVNVPIAPRYLISGFVSRPGAYTLRSGATVSQAIALAGGLAHGSDRRIKISRLVDGRPVEINAQLGDKILANDAITIQRAMF